jgi:ATP-binding cassette subfamily B (MDR/TAP) protein 1
MSSVRVALGIAATMDLEIEQLDVKTTFLHDDLEEEIYMEQLEGFVVAGKEHQVCKFKKSLHGLKQAPQQWYKKFESFMTELGCHKAQPDHCVFIKRYIEGDFIILLIYVDDMLIVENGTKRISLRKKALSKLFAMKDLRSAKQILGMKISRDRSKKMLWLSQEGT